MKDTYKPITPDFKRVLQTLVAQRAYERIQYFTDIHEFISGRAMLKELQTKEDGEYLLLATGEEVRLDRIARIGDTPAPGYDEAYFKCDLPR